MATTAQLPFHGAFAHVRNQLDYSFHKHYTRQRQLMPDAVVNTYLSKGTKHEKPKLILAAGAMGAGKSHTLKRMLDKEFDDYVSADVDKIKYDLSEMDRLLEKDPYNAGRTLHSEACTIHEILFRQAISESKNVIIDGPLRNGDFFRQLLLNKRAALSVPDDPSRRADITEAKLPDENNEGDEDNTQDSDDDYVEGGSRKFLNARIGQRGRRKEKCRDSLQQYNKTGDDGGGEHGDAALESGGLDSRPWQQEQALTMNTSYHVTIVHVIASLKVCLERVRKRSLVTRRFVPEESIRLSLTQCPDSVEKLRPFVNQVITVVNENDLPLA